MGLLWATRLAACQFFQPQGHRRSGVGERRNRREVIGGGNRAELRSDSSLTPRLDNASALPVIFRALGLAHDGIEAALAGRLPEQRACSAGCGLIKAQGLVEGSWNQRRQIEQAGDRVSGNDEIGR